MPPMKKKDPSLIWKTADMLKEVTGYIEEPETKVTKEI